MLGVFFELLVGVDFLGCVLGFRDKFFHLHVLKYNTYIYVFVLGMISWNLPPGSEKRERKEEDDYYGD